MCNQRGCREILGLDDVTLATRIKVDRVFTVKMVALGGTGLSAIRGMKSYDATDEDSILVSVPGNEVELELSGLRPITLYLVKLRAVRDPLESVYTTTTFTTGLDPPRALATRDIDEESALITWQSPYGAITGYVLGYFGPDGIMKEIDIEGGKTSYWLKNLDPATPYNLHLYAVSGAEQSPAIETVFSTVLDPPRDLEVIDVEQETAKVVWQSPRGDITGYVLMYLDPNGSVQEIYVNGTATSSQLLNLDPSSRYTIQLYAVSDTGLSSTIDTVFSTGLDPPRDLKVQNVDLHSATITWRPPRGAITEYVLINTGPGSDEQIRLDWRATDHRFSGLNPSTDYSVHLYAISGTQQSTTIDTAYTTVLDPPRDLEIRDVETETAKVFWQPPRGAITGYVLTYLDSDGSVQEVNIDETATSRRLVDLGPSSRYTVQLYAVSDTGQSSTIDTVFSTGLDPPRDLDVRNVDHNSATVSWRPPCGAITEYVFIYSGDDFEDVFQRRQNGNVNFWQKWRIYEKGFGDINDEFWMGLQKLHLLTAQGCYDLQVDLRDSSQAVHAVYDQFSVGSSRSRFRLAVGKYSGTAGDSMSYHNGYRFTTIDRDFDNAPTNCAISYKGGWWYHNCHRANLNGDYGNINMQKGVIWYAWKGNEYSIPFTEMKMRPHNFLASANRVQRTLNRHY